MDLQDFLQFGFFLCTLVLSIGFLYLLILMFVRCVCSPVMRGIEERRYIEKEWQKAQKNLHDFLASEACMYSGGREQELRRIELGAYMLYLGHWNINDEEGIRERANVIEYRQAG